MTKSRSFLLIALGVIACAAMALGVDFSNGHQIAAFGLQFDPSLIGLAAAGTIDTDGIKAELKRIADDTKEVTSGFSARLQNVEQVVAGAEFRGGLNASGAPQRVSATVLADAESSLESLRNGTTKSVRMSLPSFFPQAAAITSGDLHIPAERDSEVYGPLRRPYSVRDLLITRPTSAPSIEYLRGTRTGSSTCTARSRCCRTRGCGKKSSACALRKTCNG
ncbi:hypothetical protein [Variovorax sp. DXTD-1]|uniref:hypothetical protein n=1 Tax=Variovorax sp. DXTD-1 TaxID=2495592 RepID=UPI000F86EF80|nr:hypothetical protein [Variovorax sp. DXTD-1]RST51581.1 hypothetical protein EJI00_08385 [Variovorax sp. DXTD-1]